MRADDDGVAAFVGDEGVAVGIEDPQVADPAHTRMGRLVQTVGPVREVDDPVATVVGGEHGSVRAVTTEQEVVAVAAAHNVVAGVTNQEVVAAAAVENVVEPVASKDIGGERARLRLDTDASVALRLAARTITPTVDHLNGPGHDDSSRTPFIAAPSADPKII